MTYFYSIFWLLTWPAAIIVSYLLIQFLLKKMKLEFYE